MRRGPTLRLRESRWRRRRRRRRRRERSLRRLDLRDPTAIKPLPEGVYELPLTRELRARLSHVRADLVDKRALADVDGADLLARALSDRVFRALSSIHGDDAGEQQLALVNAVLLHLAKLSPRSGVGEHDTIDPPGEALWAVRALPASSLSQAVSPQRPRIPLTSTDLLVNAHHDVSLGAELVRELASADRVDLLCSFLKWSGYRLVADALAAFVARRPGALRVLTTAYMGATERRALDELSKLGAEVRVSYDKTRTRLHAKAWLLHRESGFSTAFIGSSNLSAAAMLDGLEWNVRLAEAENAAVVRKFAATFEQYWQDPEFAPYDPVRDAERFDEAVAADRRADSAFLTSIRVTPLPHQEQILDELAAERQRGHTRNLVVAATGTGKTIVAALDYRRLCDASGKRLSLLFVAHRKEILEQSRGVFRQTLQDGSFGELHVGDARPSNSRFVFASVQSLHEDVLATIEPNAYDVVIVDEFHHAAAPTYDRLLTRLSPGILLGLTATPERADGKSILGWFGGRIASELRLWRALDEGLLSPFQYFGVGDGTDLRIRTWTPKGYDTGELSNLYTGGHRWADLVLRAVGQYVAQPRKMRALGFCVDVAHAEFMAQRFVDKGIRAVAVSANTLTREREKALTALRDGSVQVVFSVDLFNEGIDLPDVDTVLFLRPTESATVFLQQLGRGLRHSSKKDCLTVLDFIGHANRKFRFAARFQAIAGGTRKQVERDVEAGFPHLPAGCAIHLDREAQEAVLENIRDTLGHGRRGLIDDLKNLPPATTMREFLRDAELELEDLYTGDTSGSFTQLRIAAGLDHVDLTDEERPVARAMRRMLHVDDDARLDGFAKFLDRREPPRGDPSASVQRGLHVLLGGARTPLSVLDDRWAALWRSRRVMTELRELLAALAERSRSAPAPMTGRLAKLPLLVHGTYALDEVMAALDERDKNDCVRRLREGVFTSKKWNAELLFITLEKAVGEYTPTTMYNDYPLSSTRFHWESQNAAHEASNVGLRYIHHESNGAAVLLFVRKNKQDERGETSPYRFLGPATYERHDGGRPMRVVWRLATPMPASLYQDIRVAAG